MDAVVKKELTVNQVIDMIANVGYSIIKHGGEIHRAEDTATRIGLAYGMDQVHVFAISSTILVTVEKDGVTKTQNRRVTGNSTNLDRIEQLNSLSRKICTELPSYQEVMAELRRIEGRHCYSQGMNVLFYALIGGSFAVFFGGGVAEMIVGFSVGALMRLVIWLLEYLKSASFLVNTVGAAIIVTTVKLASLVYPALNVDASISGPLMNLVPGILLTNCIRDIVSADYVAGTAKMIETLIVACSIALGVAVSVLWR
ncbi:MAG: threonine/serine exporter family protein [Lachnospiraceae bacterium]|nr:threonine/serine exporter family protein [Lachnospiraceae bacterium]